MKLRFTLVLLMMAVSSSAYAEPFTDKLAVCLVKSTTDDDKTLLMRWMFAAMASHSKVKDLSAVSQAQGEKLNKDVSGLFMELLTVRCQNETKDALQYEGSGTISASFEVLGKVAMQGLMADPEVAHYIGGIDANLDPEKMKKLMEGAAAKP